MNRNRLNKKKTFYLNDLMDDEMNGTLSPDIVSPH